MVLRIVTYLIGVALGFLFGRFLYFKRVDIFVQSDRELSHEEIVELVTEMKKAEGETHEENKN